MPIILANCVLYPLVFVASGIVAYLYSQSLGRTDTDLFIIGFSFTLGSTSIQV